MEGPTLITKKTSPLKINFNNSKTIFFEWDKSFYLSVKVKVIICIEIKVNLEVSYNKIISYFMNFSLADAKDPRKCWSDGVVFFEALCHWVVLSNYCPPLEARGQVTSVGHDIRLLFL